MHRKLRRTVVACAAALLCAVPGGAAYAAAPDRVTLLAAWTQPTAASTAAWNAARADRARWARHGFDWSTDLCTGGPERPLGFDFTLPCWHHDFGYRNYRALGRLAAHRERLDAVFHADLRRTCDTYRPRARPTCHALAWSYHRAARIFGRQAAR